MLSEMVKHWLGLAWGAAMIASWLYGLIHGLMARYYPRTRVRNLANAGQDDRAKAKHAWKSFGGILAFVGLLGLAAAVVRVTGPW